MVFDDVRTRFAAAFVRYSGPHDLAEPVYIVRIDAQLRFDLAAHVFGPRFSAENAGTQPKFAARNTRLDDLFGQVQGVRRRAGQRGGAAVVHQLDVLGRIARRHRDDGRSEVFHPVVQTQSAREKAVAVGDREQVVARGAESRQAARDRLRPDRKIAVRVTDHRGFAGRPGRGVQPDDLRLGGGEQPVRVIVPQILLGGERQFDDVVDRVDVVGRKAHLLHFVAVERGMVVNPVHQLFEPGSL